MSEGVPNQQDIPIEERMKWFRRLFSSSGKYVYQDVLSSGDYAEKLFYRLFLEALNDVLSERYDMSLNDVANYPEVRKLITDFWNDIRADLINQAVSVYADWVSTRSPEELIDRYLLCWWYHSEVICKPIKENIIADFDEVALLVISEFRDTVIGSLADEIVYVVSDIERSGEE